MKIKFEPIDFFFFISDFNHRLKKGNNAGFQYICNGQIFEL